MASHASPWWKDAIFYEIFPRSFMDADGDGVGDLRGILSRLDYLKDLGVDALWLTPIFQSPWKDSGYDVADYERIDPSMGTMADFRELLKEAHRRNLRIIIDLVINHTSDEHSWFRESRSSPNNPKRDFYIWRPARDGAQPNNWKSLVKGSVWEWDEVSGEYYLHLFSKYQPDLNWENPKVKAAVFEMMRGWLAMGVDGFRMDVINCLMKPAGLPDAQRNPGDDEPYVLDRALYADNPGMHELLQEMRRDVLEPFGACSIGEVHFNTKEAAGLYVEPARRELDLIFQTDLLFNRTGPAFIGRSIAAWDIALRGRGWNAFCLGNHDTPRQVSVLGDDGQYRSESAKALATLALTAPGSPFIFQGDELGMTNVSFERLEDYRDIEMKSFFEEKVAAGADPTDALNFLRPRSRDNSRTPMQWSAARSAGFTTGTPWIEANPNYRGINVEEQEGNPSSVLQFYRRLVALRKEHACLSLGDYRPIASGHEDLLAYRRSLPEETLLILVNLSPRSISFSTDVPASGVQLIGNYPAADEIQDHVRPVGVAHRALRLARGQARQHSWSLLIARGRPLLALATCDDGRASWSAARRWLIPIVCIHDAYLFCLRRLRIEPQEPLSSQTCQLHKSRLLCPLRAILIRYESEEDTPSTFPLPQSRTS